MEVPQSPKLLDRVRQAIRFRHLSRKTKKFHLDYIPDCILFHQKRHPREMGLPEVRAYLSPHLAVTKKKWLPPPKTLPSVPCSFSTAKFLTFPCQTLMSLSGPSAPSGCPLCSRARKWWPSWLSLGMTQRLWSSAYSTGLGRTELSFVHHIQNLVVQGWRDSKF